MKNRIEAGDDKMTDDLRYYLASKLAGWATEKIQVPDSAIRYHADEDCDGYYSCDHPQIAGADAVDDCPCHYFIWNKIMYLILSAGSHGIDVGGWYIEFVVADQDNEIVAAILALGQDGIIAARE